MTWHMGNSVRSS